MVGESCDFCGRTAAEAGRLFSAAVASICLSCARDAVGTLGQGELALSEGAVGTTVLPLATATTVTTTRSVTSETTTAPAWSAAPASPRRGITLELPALDRSLVTAALALVGLAFLVGRRSRRSRR